MRLIFVLASLLLCQSVQPTQSPETKGETRLDPEIAAKLVKVKRIYVESFGDDNAAKQLQAMVIDALSETKRFVVTENKDQADAVLKGHTLEKTRQELHSSSEGTAVGRSAIADSSASTETVNEASIAARLVAQDGDVIWTTTKESKGAKYKGALADVAEQLVKQLLRDLEKVQPKEK
jgi:hypothetical protein